MFTKQVLWGNYGRPVAKHKKIYPKMMLILFYISDREIDIPTDFPFPFEPYDIQKGFMHELYRCLELGKVGIFESPTGTVSGNASLLQISSNYSASKF